MWEISIEVRTISIEERIRILRYRVKRKIDKTPEPTPPEGVPLGGSGERDDDTLRNVRTIMYNHCRIFIIVGSFINERSAERTTSIFIEVMTTITQSADDQYISFNLTITKNRIRSINLHLHYIDNF